MVTGLDLLFLEVNNLEESLRFYQERLGFETVSQNLAAEPPIATVGAGSLRITLVQQIETMLKRGRGVHFVLAEDRPQRRVFGTHPPQRETGDGVGARDFHLVVGRHAVQEPYRML